MHRQRQGVADTEQGNDDRQCEQHVDDAEQHVETVGRGRDVFGAVLHVASEALRDGCNRRA